MEPRAKDDLNRQFARGVLLLGGALTALFALEYVVEVVRLKPTFEQMSWQGHNNAKLVDSLSPIARAYNNILAMLIATVGLAIPLTANIHTPKLIDLFLKDRINRIVLTLMALGAANVLWVLYLIGPEFAPMWAFRTAVYGSFVGWVVLIPYFFYVVRFVDPSTIITRLKQDAVSLMQAARREKIDHDEAQAEIQERLFQIGTIVIKSIDRADRSVAREGVWALKKVLDAYREHKAHMSERWFYVDKGDFPGMSHHAIEMINRKHTWMEMQVLYQLLLCYEHALTKAPDTVSAISNVTRIIATRAADRGDGPVVSLSIRYFNTFLRVALNRREVRAAFDIFYQYRQLAGELCDNPKFVKRIGDFFVTYAEVAEQAGVEFVSNLAGFDLVHVVEQAYLAKNPAADEVLEDLLRLPTGPTPALMQARLRAWLIAAGFFSENDLQPQLERVRAALSSVPPMAVKLAADHLASIGKRAFWEITDRAINIEWTPASRREHIERFARTFAAAAE